jgi:protein-disulfide isomerase
VAPGRSALSATSTTGRQLEIFDGLFRINLDEVPLIGAKDAPAVIVSLLDYTCRHCRQMHGVLLEAERAHRGRLAIAMLPMPLDAACNKVIPRTAPQHADACQYANLGLAVWRADPSKMDRFNDWLFEPPQPPGMESALGFAMEIVGDEALGRAMNDPWVRKQLAQDVAIYEATYKRFGKGVMPQLVVGDQIVFGELEHGLQDLEALLRDILK